MQILSRAFLPARRYSEAVRMIKRQGSTVGSYLVFVSAYNLVDSTDFM